MDTFLDTSKLSKLNQEETGNLNRPVTKEDIETVLKAFQLKRKVQGQMDSLQNSTRL